MYLCDTCRNIEKIESKRSNGLVAIKYEYHCQIYSYIEPCIKCIHYEKGEPRKVGEDCESNNL